MNDPTVRKINVERRTSSDGHPMQAAMSAMPLELLSDVTHQSSQGPVRMHKTSICGLEPALVPGRLGDKVTGVLSERTSRFRRRGSPPAFGLCRARFSRDELVGCK